MIAAEGSTVRFGTTSIAYAIKRSARRGTVSIAIDPREGVLVTAPRSTPVARLDRVVHQKAAWILSRLKRQRDLAPPPPAREFVSGETFRYLGRQVRLRLVRGGGADVKLLRGHLVTGGGPDLRARLVAWYREHALPRLVASARAWAPKVGVSVPRVLLRDQSRRWGSCDRSGVVRLNWRIVQAPPRLIDYVVAHELVHLMHPHHGPEFWSTLGRAMPDYDGRKAQLRALGPALVW
jgi:predicted metal-dependent hydrolase